MIRFLGFLIVVFSVFGLSWQLLNQRLPAWAAESRYVLLAASQSGADLPSWNSLATRADETLPKFYPFSVVHGLLDEGQAVILATQTLDASLNVDWEASRLPIEQFAPAWELVDQIDHSLTRVSKELRSLPRWLMNAEQKEIRDRELAQLRVWQRYVSDVKRLQQVWDDFVDREERVLVLLQNRNEPRSTGGFVGSLVLLDFSAEFLSWRFLDIYELDRLLAENDHLEAPTWFHGLSETISLRDANFWPDFQESSQQYRQFFEAIEQKPPRTIIGVNLTVIEALLHFTGPVKLEPWGVTLDENNFDLALQFLVESKINGRFSVKQPVLQFAQKLLAPEHFKNLDIAKIRSFDWPTFFAEKHVLAHSQNLRLQKLIEKWQFDGRVRQKFEADNFLQFDFVSIGANKSDKFVWTKLWHDSEIDRTGRIKNTLQVKRTHALQPGEVNDLLGTNRWSPNVRDLLTPDLLWKLGGGENRVVLRVTVPREAKLLNQKNPSGVITSAQNRDFKIWEIPLNVVPGESLEVTLEYETQIARGSQRWRPYFLELVGTPARDKTSLLTTISTVGDGQFTANTNNIGRPQPLVDQDFRAVIEFD